MVEDACRGVDLGNIEQKKRSVTESHGLIVDSAKVGGMAWRLERRGEEREAHITGEAVTLAARRIRSRWSPYL